MIRTIISARTLGLNRNTPRQWYFGYSNFEVESKVNLKRWRVQSVVWSRSLNAFCDIYDIPFLCACHRH